MLGAALVAGVVLLALPVLEAAKNEPIVCNGTKDHLIFWFGIQYHARTTGFLAAGVGNPSKTADGRKTIALTVEDVFSKGTAEGLGEVTFEDDPSRDAGASSLIANEKGPTFPATQTMRFHFTVTIDGHAYRSINPAVVTSTCVTSLPPAPGTIYTLVERVAVEDTASPGKVAFTIEPGKAFTAG